MEQLLEILGRLHDDVDFETCTALVDNGILNSFDIVSLLAEIDEIMDVKIPANEIVPENFNSAQALYALIQRLEDEES